MTQEKKCKMVGNCNEFTTEDKCNSSCDFYNSGDVEILSEEMEKKVEAELKKESLKRPDVRLEYSDLPKFDKGHEFFVMKKHVFLIQSVSPKKIILKFKRKLSQTDALQDGCYVFKDQKGEVLEPTKVFLKFDREAKKKKEKK